MKTIRLLPVAILAALTAGCLSSRHYAEQVRPVDVPATYAQADGARDDTRQALPALADGVGGDVREDPWWHGFGDARLDRLIDRALDANANLAAAGWALRQARLQSRLAGNDFYPQPRASVDASGSRHIDRGDTIERNHGARVEASWELDLFGRLRAQRDVRRWQEQASAEDLHATALALVGEVCRNYWKLAYLNQSIDAGEQDLAALRDIVALVEAQHREGAVSQLELREAQQNLESRRATQSTLEQQRVETRSAMTVLLDGEPWPRQDEPRDLRSARPLAISEGLPAQLLARRPDLRAAERRLRAALAGVDVTARGYYPTLSLTGALGAGSRSLSNLLDDPVATLGAGLSLPFLNVSRMRTDTEMVGTAYLRGASEFRTTLHTALQEVERALSAREQLRTQASARTRSYALAQDVARTYEARYREGAGALRVWLDAQNVLRDAELELARVQRDRVDNDVALILALGGSGQRHEAGGAGAEP